MTIINDYDHIAVKQKTLDSNPYLHGSKFTSFPHGMFIHSKASTFKVTRKKLKVTLLKTVHDAFRKKTIYLHFVGCRELFFTKLQAPTMRRSPSDQLSPSPDLQQPLVGASHFLQASMFQKSDLSMAVYNYSPIGSGSDRPTAQAFILLSALI